MATTYTFDVYCTLDGFGSYGPGGDWGGYWGKQGPQFLEHRATVLREPQRMVLGGTTFREFVQMLPAGAVGPDDDDPAPWLMRNLPTTVVSTTVEDGLDWPDATVVRGDAVEVVARLKEESDVPLRSHGSLSLNRALMAAGLVDRVQVSVFPVVSGRTGTDPVFGGADDFDLELLDSHLFDGRIQELVTGPRCTADQAVGRQPRRPTSPSGPPRAAPAPGRTAGPRTAGRCSPGARTAPATRSAGGSGSHRSPARTHHSRVQSSGSQCSTSSVARGSASRFRSRCSRVEDFGFTVSTGTPTQPPASAA